MISAVPKPAPTQKKPKKRLQAKQWGVSKKPKKPLRAVNPERAQKRAQSKKAHYASPEYRAARKVALNRSGGRCEALNRWALYGLEGVYLPGETIVAKPGAYPLTRCPCLHSLHFHEEDYGSKTGLIRAIRGYIVCEAHHAYIERTRYPHRHPRRTV